MPIFKFAEIWHIFVFTFFQIRDSWDINKSSITQFHKMAAQTGPSLGCLWLLDQCGTSIPAKSFPCRPFWLCRYFRVGLASTPFALKLPKPWSEVSHERDLGIRPRWKVFNKCVRLVLWTLQGLGDLDPWWSQYKVTWAQRPHNV